MILVYVTCKDVEEAKNISQTLLEKHLIACANFFPVNSMYSWKGSINNDSEFVLILKTVEENFKKIEKEIKKVHSYECPCIISIKVTDVNKEFVNYLHQNIILE